MKYLLDTNIIIDHIRGRERINLKIVEEDTAISIITLGELIYGGYKSVNPEKSLQIIQNTILLLGLSIESLDEKSINEFGETKAVLEKAGSRLDDFDLLIAAIAKSSKRILLTKNVKHFERIKDLKLSQGYKK